MSSTAPPAAASTPGPGDERGHQLTGALRFVSPTGSDTSGDGSRSRPWRTWDRGVYALAELGGGHTLVLRDGTYHAGSGTRQHSPQGEDGEPIRITSHPGETAVITGAIRLYDPAHLVIDHLAFESAPDADPDQPLLRVTNGANWSIEHNEFRNLRTIAALHVTGWGGVSRPSSAVVRDNSFHDQRDARPEVNKNTQHFVYAGVGPDGDLIVSGNEFYRGENTGGAVKVGPRSLGRVEISQNTFVDNDPYAVLLEGELSEVDIRGNLFVDSGASHVHLWEVQSDLRDSVRDNRWWGQSLVTSASSAWGASVDHVTGPGNTRSDPGS